MPEKNRSRTKLTPHRCSLRLLSPACLCLVAGCLTACVPGRQLPNAEFQEKCRAAARAVHPNLEDVRIHLGGERLTSTEVLHKAYVSVYLPGTSAARFGTCSVQRERQVVYQDWRR